MSGAGCGQFGGQRPGKIAKRPKHEYCNEEARKLFEKKFRFSRGNWELPESTCLFTASPWKVKQLQVLKSRLNFHKSQLNDFPLEQWSRHTRRRNPAGDVAWRLRTHVNPEFHTQAWSKMFECACTYELVASEARSAGRLASLHLCEAPGAFVTALNHYLQLHHPTLQWEWTACTLNPYYEGNSPSNMISDDRFMAHTLTHWSFGEDSTGDLMRWDNSRDIVRAAPPQVMLVTADGSIDCLERPDAQEDVTSPLHYCEVVTALQALHAGGTFVCKLFTMFEHSTVNLLYLLNVLFGEVNIFKPVTSRSGNSEVYAVCIRYSGSAALAPYIDSLKSGFGTELYEEKSLFPLEVIPKDFIEQVVHCANFFSSIQCNVIDDNLQAFLMKDFYCAEVKRLREIVADEFMTFYDVRPITVDREILRGLLHEECVMNINPRDHRGSYTERSHYHLLPLRERYESLNSYFVSNSVEDWMILPKDKISWRTFFDADIDIQLQFTHGKPLDELRSSKFVFSPILKLYRRLMEETELEGASACENIIRSVDEVTGKYDVSTVRWRILPLPSVTGGYGSSNRTSLELLIDAIESLQDDDSLFLPNFEILRHFSVGVLYILCKALFRSVGFTDGCGVALGGFVRSERAHLLREVLEEGGRTRAGRELLGVLPVQDTNSGEFYNNVIFYNNTLYRNKSCAMLNNLRLMICDR